MLLTNNLKALFEVLLPYYLFIRCCSWKKTYSINVKKKKRKSDLGRLQSHKFVFHIISVPGFMYILLLCILNFCQTL